jgi:hypothetical protein
MIKSLPVRYIQCRIPELGVKTYVGVFPETAQKQHMGGMKPGKESGKLPDPFEVTGARNSSPGNEPVQFIPVHQLLITS